MVFVDEASTGLDPEARRRLWSIITDERKADRSIVLTTHSMPEAEFLCQRIAIVVNGTLQCLGTAQHLKNRFGTGWAIDIHVGAAGATVIGPEATSGAAATVPQASSPVPLSTPSPPPVPSPGIEAAAAEPVVALVRAALPMAQLEKANRGTFTFHVAAGSMPALSHVFAALEALRAGGHISEFAVSQPTLEQVFIRFARAQEEDAR